MNILIQLTKDFKGCGFYRLFQPHNHLCKNYPVKVTANTGFWKSDNQKYSDAELKQFDIIVWHKGVFELEDIKKAKQLGIKTVIDFDDHWVLNPEHSLSGSWVKNNTPVKMHKALLYADYITCTTDILADAIYPHNKNVCVLPNAMDMNYEGCKVQRKEEKEFCFGYLGGHFHYRDVSLLRNLRISGNFRMRLFGYDGTYVYDHYAKILEGNGNFDVFKGLPIYSYPQFYNLMDCSLVPLENNNFNRYKSELKLIEAGFFKKAVIVSNVHPYKKVINKENCLTVINSVDWSRHAQSLIDNPNQAKDLGEALYESVKHYNIDIVNKKRYNFYKDVLKNVNISGRILTGGMEILN